VPDQRYGTRDVPFGDGFLHDCVDCFEIGRRRSRLSMDSPSWHSVRRLCEEVVLIENHKKHREAVEEYLAKTGFLQEVFHFNSQSRPLQSPSLALLRGVCFDHFL
jgi:hypothetical protein